MKSALKKKDKNGKLRSTGFFVEKIPNGPLLAWTHRHYGGVEWKQVLVTHRVFRRAYKFVLDPKTKLKTKRVDLPPRLMGLALDNNFDAIWRLNSFVVAIDDPHTSILESLRQASESWWVNADGVLERVATKYEAMHPEVHARDGWELRSAAEVAQLIDQRRAGPKPAGVSILDEEHAARQKERRRASKEKKVEKLTADVKRWERRKALAHTKVKKLTRQLSAAKRALENES